jgi:hypothetical protein
MRLSDFEQRQLDAESFAQDDKRRAESIPKAAPWPRGAWEVTQDEFLAARDDKTPNALQVVRYCSGDPFVGDMAKEWLKQYRCQKKVSAPVASPRPAIVTVPDETEFDDDIEGALSDALSNSEGRANAWYLRHALAQRGLVIVESSQLASARIALQLIGSTAVAAANRMGE